MRNYCSILLFLIFVFSTNVLGQEINFSSEEKAWIKAHPTIEFGYEPNWAPYEIYKNGKYTGIVGEYVKILEEKTGIKMVPIKDITWEESIKGLKNGTIHMVPCCAITPDREKFLEFTEIYINDPMVIVTRKDFEYVGDVNDLNGKKVALPKSYYTTEIIAQDFPNIKIIEKQGIQECLEALSYGESDAFIGNLGVVSYYMNNYGFTNLKIAAPTNYRKNGIALAVTKDWVIFRNIADKVFAEISEKKKSQIRKSWISVRYEHGLSTEKIIIWVSIIGSFVLIVFLAFYIWNKTLQKQIRLRKESELRLIESIQNIEKKNAEKELLLQEVHHRVKNNLQIVTSLMRLQSNSSKNEATIESLNQAIDRIKTIALMHEKIYQSPNLSDISIEDYIKTLAADILQHFSNNDIILKVSSEVSTIQLDSIVPLALILNELITNSLKYGLKEKPNPEIIISFTNAGSELNMSYFDNGQWIDNPDSDCFGTSLIEIFTEQLDGHYKLIKDENGTEYLFTFDSSAFQN